MAATLANYGMQLGVGYQAAASLRAEKSFEFIHQFEPLQMLISTVGGDNVGAVLDTWQFFVSGDDIGEAIAKLGSDKIVNVVLSDAVGANIGKGTGIGTIQSEATDDVTNLPSSVSGTVFSDISGDGTQNGREKGLAGVEVKLSGAASKTTTSATQRGPRFLEPTPSPSARSPSTGRAPRKPAARAARQRATASRSRLKNPAT